MNGHRTNNKFFKRLQEKAVCLGVFLLESLYRARQIVFFWMLYIYICIWAIGNIFNFYFDRILNLSIYVDIIS